MIFHVADRSEWAAALAAGEYRWSTRDQTLDEVGFIHCSTADQLAGVLHRFYADADDDALVVLHIDPERIEAEVRHEGAGDGAELFPHIYGPLLVAAVVHTSPVVR